MSIINDKNISINTREKTDRQAPRPIKKFHRFRQRSESTCQFLCFRNCNEEPTIEAYPSDVPNLKLNKVSLKRNYEEDHLQHEFRKSTSDKNLNLNNRFRSETSRSQNQLKQMMLFKKKARIENDIQKVDQQMSRLTIKFEKNLNQLKAIKRQLQILRNS